MNDRTEWDDPDYRSGNTSFKNPVLTYPFDPDVPNPNTFIPNCVVTTILIFRSYTWSSVYVAGTTVVNGRVGPRNKSPPPRGYTFKT